MRWWTSDHHFGHDKIIGYCHRPFADVSEMNRALVDRWNNLVGDGDEVWILGDLAMGDRSAALSDHVADLRGTKFLVPGNHDLCWEGGKAPDLHAAMYLDAGRIDRIAHRPEPVTLAGRTVRLSHFPYQAQAPEATKRFAQWRLPNNGDWLLCGHVHEAWRQRDRQVNVGVDAWHFEPVNDDTLAALVAAGPADIPCPVYGAPGNRM